MPYLEHQGQSLYYEEAGEGPAVVLGHSFFCSGEMWRHQVPELARSYRVINPDYRGHGRSGPVRREFDLYDLVDDTLALLDHLGVEQATWAGLSVGGMTAMRAALTSRERVRGLILLDTVAGAERSWTKFKYRPMGAGTRLVGLRPFLPAIVKGMFGPTTCRENPQLVKEWKARFASADAESMRHYLDLLMHRDSVVSRLGEIRIPTLVMVGVEDRALPPQHSRKIDAGLPDSSLVEVPCAGHLPPLEQPEAVTSALLDFLAHRVG